MTYSIDVVRLFLPIRFLSKSFLGFVAFNVISYAILIAELLMVWLPTSSEEDGLTEEMEKIKGDDRREFYAHIFNGCYAVLMFVVVIFFLIYGVEVFFKVSFSSISIFLISIWFQLFLLVYFYIQKNKKGIQYPSIFVCGNIMSTYKKETYIKNGFIIFKMFCHLFHKVNKAEEQYLVLTLVC